MCRASLLAMPILLNYQHITCSRGERLLANTLEAGETSARWCDVELWTCDQVTLIVVVTRSTVSCSVRSKLA